MLFRTSYIDTLQKGLERRVRGSNPHDLAVITVFKTDKHASLATLRDGEPRRSARELP